MVDVEKLLAAITEAERLAHEAAQARSWWSRKPIGRTWDDGGGYVMDSNDASLWDDSGSTTHHMPEAASAFIARNDPAAVFRRCAAERKLIAAFQGAELAVAEANERNQENPAAVGLWGGLHAGVVAIAAGYGIPAGEATA